MRTRGNLVYKSEGEEDAIVRFWWESEWKKKSEKANEMRALNDFSLVSSRKVNVGLHGTEKLPFIGVAVTAADAPPSSFLIMASFTT